MDILIKNQIGRTTRVDFNLRAGEPLRLQMKFRDASCNPINLSGCRIKGRIAFPIPVDLDTGDGSIVITDALGGIARATVAGAQTIDVPSGSYEHDMWIYDSTVTPFFMYAGFANTLPSITPLP